MIILSIETSCDETAVSIVKAEGGLQSPVFSVLGSALYSQVSLHAHYGGVYPTLAKREHGKNLVPLLTQALKEAGLLKEKKEKEMDEKWDEKEIETILSKEDGLFDQVKPFIEQYEKPEIDMIAVTSGPGLEPALWVGISFARALGVTWNIPVIPTNHMKGHIASVLIKTEENQESRIKNVEFPAIALLISGGHTEIVYIKEWGSYSTLGQTRDDAVGEAFDKVARMLALPYPGGPEISKLAEKARKEHIPREIEFPRPMINSENLDFSFSGLKTSVLYKIRDLTEHSVELTDHIKMDIARAFEDAVVDVLLSKTEKAIIESNAKTLIIAGGVIANKKIREAFTARISDAYHDVTLCIPDRDLATDNAIMIAIASYIDVCVDPKLLTEPQTHIKAEGNLSF